MLAALHPVLLDQVLDNLDVPDLARVEAVCRPLKAAAGPRLQPWREATGLDSEWTAKLLYNVRQVQAVLLQPRDDDGGDRRWHLAKDRFDHMQQTLGVHSFTEWDKRALGMHGHGWFINMQIDHPDLLDTIRLEFYSGPPDTYYRVHGTMEFNACCDGWAGETKYQACDSLRAAEGTSQTRRLARQQAEQQGRELNLELRRVLTRHLSTGMPSAVEQLEEDTQRPGGYVRLYCY